MILRIEDIKNMSTAIVNALDTSESTQISETLELKTEGTMLYMGIANSDYCARVKFDLGEECQFHATVDADKFLKMISLTTTDTIEFTTTEKTLTVKGNGTYRFPLIYDNDKLLELPMIDIGEVSTEFDINQTILSSINLYNTKEIDKKYTQANIVQKMYYLDEKGCLTFTNSACVNCFDLPSPIKILLPKKLVNLFKIFKSETVHFMLGHDVDSEGNTFTKVRFETDASVITYRLSQDSESLVSRVPVDAIRGRVTKIYPYRVVINRSSLDQALKRLNIFEGKGTMSFTFNTEDVTIFDESGENSETLYYDNEDSNILEPYKTFINVNDLQMTLNGSLDSHITISFGDNQAVVISKENLYNVIPESR